MYRTFIIAFTRCFVMLTLIGYSADGWAVRSTGCQDIDGAAFVNKSDVYYQEINNARYVWSAGETIRATWTNPTSPPDTARLLIGASAAPGTPANTTDFDSAVLGAGGTVILEHTLTQARTYVGSELDVQNGDVVLACKVLQTITFNQPANQTLQDGNTNLVATSDSGLAVTFASTTPGVCGMAGATMTPVATGTCTVSVSQAGDADYYPATSVSRSFTITNAAQLDVLIDAPAATAVPVPTLPLYGVLLMAILVALQGGRRCRLP